MKRLTLSIVVLSLLAFGLAAVAAQAEAPHWEYCKKTTGGKFEDSKCSKEGGVKEWERSRLKAAETLPLKGAAKKEFVLSNGLQTITCKKLKLENSKVVGSEPGNPGTAKTTVVFEECSIAGNGAPCEVEGKKIKTEPIKVTLDRSNKANTIGEKLLALFQPETGTVFVKIKVTGTGCSPVKSGETLAVEGTVAGELEIENPEGSGKLEAVKLKENEKLIKKGFIGFPAALIKVAWVDEKGAEPKEVKLGLKLFGKAATKFEGKAEIELEGIEDWGVFG